MTADNLCPRDPEYEPFPCMLKNHFTTSEIHKEKNDFGDYGKGGFHGFPWRYEYLMLFHVNIIKYNIIFLFSSMNISIYLSIYIYLYIYIYIYI